MSTEEPKKESEGQEQPTTPTTDQTTDAAKTKPQIQKKENLDSSRTGLTAEFGKPVSTKKDVVSLNEQIESQYQQLKYKKFAQSAISSAFGDLLGPSKSKEASEEEAKVKEDESKTE